MITAKDLLEAIQALSESATELRNPNMTITAQMYLASRCDAIALRFNRMLQTIEIKTHD